jgi:hypothetical protein
VLHQTTAQAPSDAPQPALQPSSSQSSAAAIVAPAAVNANANTSAAPATASEDDLQQKALEILREKKAQNPPASSISGTPPVTEAEVAPRLTTENDEVHARALKILRQQMQDSAAVTTNSGPQPSPYLQQRLDQMKSELEAPAKQAENAKAAATAAGAAAADSGTQAPDDYVRQLEDTARRAAAERGASAVPTTSTVTSSPAAADAPTSAPVVDPKIREMLERQNREIARQSETVSTRIPARPYLSPRRALSPESEQVARQILAQQEQATATLAPGNSPELSPANTPAPAPAVAQVPAQPAPPSVPSARTVNNAGSGTIAPVDTQVGYSKELEERARQILLERAQNQASTTPAPAPAPASAPSATPTAPAQTMPAPARATSAQAPSAVPAPSQPAPTSAAIPAQTAPAAATTATPNSNLNDPRIDEIHAEALQALDQIRSGAAVAPSAPASKQERLRVITQLYKADKMTPAEYHRKRAAIIASPE